MFSKYPPPDQDLPFERGEDASYWDAQDTEQAKRAKPRFLIVAAIAAIALLVIAFL